ncbi:MAG: hypothetical protein HDR20_11430 [Lachnospiraceae bacterium]|nr:hypothetical protein [Lachnospiraceae bacterium]
MEKQLEEILSRNVQIAKIDKLTSLPIFMSIRKIDIIKIAKQSFALVDISEERTLTVSAMKKQCQKYEEELQMPVAYKLEIDSIAMRNVLIKNGICFISLPGNICLPFWGVVLQDVHKKKSIKIDKMMPATQMLFLELLYSDSSSLSESLGARIFQSAAHCAFLYAPCNLHISLRAHSTVSLS